MNLRRRKPEEPEINVISLVDVMFMLLLFFMITTTFNTQSLLKIDLPSADAPEQAAPQEAVRVAIAADGRYFVNGQELVNPQADTLRRAIAAAVEGRKDPPFVIEADAKAPHQAVVRAMSVAGQLGLTQISIATTGEEQSGQKP